MESILARVDSAAKFSDISPVSLILLKLGWLKNSASTKQCSTRYNRRFKQAVSPLQVFLMIFILYSVSSPFLDTGQTAAEQKEVLESRAEDDDDEDELKFVSTKGVQSVSEREQREVKLERSGWMTKQGSWITNIPTMLVIDCMPPAHSPK